MTYNELEELVRLITEDLEDLATKRCNVSDAIVTMLDNIKQYPGDGDYKAAYRADSKWVPIEPRDPIKNNKWLS